MKAASPAERLAMPREAPIQDLPSQAVIEDHPMDKDLSVSREKPTSGGVRDGIDPHLAATTARFARAVLAALWEGCDLDGGEVQDLAEKHGLIREVAFHPARHDDHLGVGAQVGDPWWVEEKWLAKLAAADTSDGKEIPRETNNA
jgi:hypothetical protein